MKKRIALVIVALLAGLIAAGTGCAVSSHATAKGTLGSVRNTAALEAALAQSPEEGATVELESINSADWAVPRSGLINLDNPVAKQAGLVDSDEPIGVFFHVIRHPTKGTFIVDTGVEVALRDAPADSAMSGLIRAAMGMEEKMKVRQPLGEWVKKEGRLDGVFLTHLHLDHVTGMRDVPNSTPVYCGPGEAGVTGLQNVVVRGSTDRALEGKGALQEWPFELEPNGAFDSVIDVFGDGSVWALWVPGHTPGSTAYLVRTRTGPVLLTGDASHTRWGWEHAVEPGTYTGDGPRGRVSFEKLLAFAAKHPNVTVHLGHQP